MFDSLENVTKKKFGRREFLGAAAAAGLTFGYGWLREPKMVGAVSGNPADKSGQVKIVEFSDDGRRLKVTRTAKIVKTDAEWQRQLTPDEFDITRHADTEMAFSGKYWDLHEKGLFRCICCGNALFSSGTKFDSGTGWPSFWAPIAEENLYTTRDFTLGMVRDAVSCTLCDAHLGHVFDDGPKPTGLRYCMNSASLRFVKHA